MVEDFCLFRAICLTITDLFVLNPDFSLLKKLIFRKKTSFELFIYFVKGFFFAVVRFQRFCKKHKE
ncbi:MAG TPA: hypothetical protein DIT08_09010 [Enterococcus sp.]|nr:hypothetical protein RV07_GL000823 [Enterococcus malodoratus]HCM86188.1 hypothetical protein [Enterococcus sp.]